MKKTNFFKLIYSFILLFIFSIFSTFGQNIVTNGDFENDLEGWVMVINDSEVGTTLELDESNPVSGSKSLLLDHKAVGKKGMWRINARTGVALDSGYTYDVYATVKVETTYPDGKRLGLVTKENQSIFSHYWTQQTGVYHIDESFYWSAMSADSITLQWQLGYAGEDYGLNSEAQEFKVYIDDVRVIKRETIQPTAIAIDAESRFLVVGDTKKLSASIAPEEAGEFISWSSQNNTIVSVDDGEITAESAGQAYIYVKSEVNSDLKDSVLVTVSDNIMENGGFENGMEGWVINLNDSEVGTNVNVVDEGALGGQRVLLTTHPAVGKKGMWRIQARTGIPLDSGYTYLVRAKLRCENDYEAGKRAGIVLKEAQSVFAHYFFVDEEVYNFEEKFVWNSTSADSITLMLQYGYAGEDIGTGDTLEFKFYLDDVVVAKKPAVELDDIDIVNDNINLTGGAVANVAYTLTPEDGDFSKLNWSTTDETVVLVNDGILQPVGEGETKIYVEANPWDLKDSVTVKIEEVVLTGIEIAGIERIEAGTSDVLNLIWKPQLPINSEVTWKSSDDNILTVESNGSIRAINQGFATVTATSTLGNFTDQFLVEVFSSVPVTGVELNDGDFAMSDGDSKQLSYTISPPDASVKSVTWASSNSDVATVSANGKITANGVGTAEITVTTADGGFTDKITVTVNPVDVTGISLNISSYEGYTNRDGGAVLLIATVEPDNATNNNIMWSSNNQDIATVDGMGLVSFLANGNVQITATTDDGDYTATCDITILTGVTGVSISDRKVTMNVDETYQLSANLLPETASNTNVTWESSDEDVVTVNANGLVTAIAAGSASVSVTTEDGGRKIGCTVTVEQPSGLRAVTLPQWKVYPNPANRILHIQVSEKIITLEIYTANGQKMQSIQVHSQTIEIPLHDYQSGMYLIRAITNTGDAAMRKIFID